MTDGSAPPAEDLVEEKKPASLLIAQFFLFPLIIIGICVGIFLLFGYLTYEQRDPQEFLNEIRAGSETRRWQAAYELSNIISADKEKIRDTDFIHDVVAVYRNSREELKLTGNSVREDPRVRRFLILTMGHMGDKRAVPALVEGLGDPDLESRIYTLWALGMIGDNAAVPGVRAELRSDDPAVRKTAAYVLGVLKDPGAAHDLQVALNDPKEEVRWNAAMALAQLNDASGSDLLLRLIDRSYVAMLEGMTDEQKSELMVNAVKCLGILKFEAARDRISALSESDPDLAVRDASLEALKKY